ncbi:MAG: CAAD domain-containing protein [Synechococcaceae cyanobacterium ELA445]
MVESSAPGNGDTLENTPPDSGESAAVEAPGTTTELAAEAAVAEAPAVEPPSAPAEPPAVEPPPVEAEPAPRPTPAPAPPATNSVFSTSLEVPAVVPSAETPEGGEWDLLLSKIRQWVDRGELDNLISSARTPALVFGGLVGVLLVLRVYAALLGAIDSLPLVPGLLELTGVVWLARFGATNLVRSGDRNKILSQLQQRWNAFRGNR